MASTTGIRHRSRLEYVEVDIHPRFPLNMKRTDLDGLYYTFSALKLSQN